MTTANQGRCYACDQAATSREHVPPRGLFPTIEEARGENLRKELITVPSCDLHNSEKSGDDEYLRLVLVQTFTSGRHAKNVAAGRVARAILRRPALQRELDGRSRPMMFFSRYNGFPTRVLSLVEDDKARSHKSFELIGRGLYHHHTGVTFARDVGVIVEFMRLSEDEPWAHGQGQKAAEGNLKLEELVRRTDEHYQGLPYHGANPQVFSYQISRDAAVRLPLKTGVRSPIFKRQICAAPPTSVVRTASG
ncbi:hypothetical protein [Pseudorhodoferax sp. Leaf274]|uniref:hypothetical protein n=1 Tax=Pseudorhodoferax sp. Leaf274 TaxID=1736318 RepID=UPI0012E198A8|nr:hypothetical protein [Pseudorhodoferax sp. Leaf274]